MQCTTIRLMWLAAGLAPKLGDGRHKAASILPFARSVAAASEAWGNTECGVLGKANPDSAKWDNLD